MPDPEMATCEKGSKQLDSTTSEHSTTHSVEDKGREDSAALGPLTVAPNIMPRIDYSSASSEIEGNVYLAYAFPRPRQNRAPNFDPPDFSQYPVRPRRATVVTWDRKTGIGSLFEPQSGSTMHITFEQIGPMYGALIVGTQVIFQIVDFKFQTFWVDDDRYYVLYREAAICEAQYPYMREYNVSIDYDPNRDYFRCPRLDDKDVNTHLEVYSMKHND